jgi:hypothetical protein
MKVARIVAPFGLSAVLFVLADLSSKDSTSGYFPVMLMGIGRDSTGDCWDCSYFLE